MKKNILVSVVCVLLGCGVSRAGDQQADVVLAEGYLSGSGEFGFASTTGNTHSQNLDAKVDLSYETRLWKKRFFFSATRVKNQEKTVDATGIVYKRYKRTVNRYNVGVSAGYKFNPRSYIVGTTRYARDDFGATRWQAVVSIGYGYIGLKTRRTELSFEIGPGFKQYQMADTTIWIDGKKMPYTQDRQQEGVIRGSLNYSYRINANTSFDNTVLLEIGPKDKYFQNDAGFAVSITRKLLLRLVYEVRHHSVVLPGARRTDTLTSTNIVYKF